VDKGIFFRHRGSAACSVVVLGRRTDGLCAMSTARGTRGLWLPQTRAGPGLLLWFYLPLRSCPPFCPPPQCTREGSTLSRTSGRLLPLALEDFSCRSRGGQPRRGHPRLTCLAGDWECGALYSCRYCSAGHQRVRSHLHITAKLTHNSLNKTHTANLVDVKVCNLVTTTRERNGTYHVRQTDAVVAELRCVS
jgi:hypothetical protein